MSRRLIGPLAGRALNQIYHVQLPFSEYDALGWNPCGIVRSWHWTDKLGWTKTGFGPSQNAAIPFGSGFGCRKDPDAWAHEIAVRFKAATANAMYWTTLTEQFPALTYVLPSDLRLIVFTLGKKHKITALNDENGFPVQIGATS
jgi:hypothetical protein